MDVGANIGYYSLLLASRGSSVHAFEPFPETARKLRRNISLNPGAAIEVHELALSDHEGSTGMSVPDAANCGMNYLSGAGTIQTCTLDRFVESHDLRHIDFIKVDVEGSEVAFLRGAATTIRRFRPILMVEVNPETLARFGESAANLVDLLRRYHYRRLYTAGALGRFHPLNALPERGDPNVFAFPND